MAFFFFLFFLAFRGICFKNVNYFSGYYFLIKQQVKIGFLLS